MGELLADLAKQHSAMTHQAYAAPLHRLVRAAGELRVRVRVRARVRVRVRVRVP